MTTAVAFAGAIGLLIVGIAARIHTYGLARRAVGDTDELFHLSYIEAIRCSGHRVPKRFPSFIGPGRNSYPAGYHWALSFLPRRAVSSIGHHGALIGDLVVGGAISVLLAERNGFTEPAAVALVGLYIATPALTLINVGPRSFHLTPRLASQVIYGLMIIAALTARGHPTMALLAIEATLLAVLLLTSKFALQVVVFALPVFLLAGPAWFVLLCFGGGVAAATLLSRGFFVWQVRAQLEHLWWYTRRYLPMVRKVSAAELLDAAAARDMRRLVRLVTLINPMTSGICRHMHIVAAGIWIIASTPDLNATAQVAGTFVLAGVLGFVATLFGHLRVLGEPERYLEFALPASWFVFWSLPRNSTLLVVLILAITYEAAWHVFNVRVMRLSESVVSTARNDRSETLSVLGRLGPVRCLFLDIKDAYAVHLLDGPIAVMFSGAMSLKGDVGGFLERFFWRYPFVDPRQVESLVARYGIDVIVVSRDAEAAVRAQAGIAYDLRMHEVAFENASYALLRVTRETGANAGWRSEETPMVRS